MYLIIVVAVVASALFARSILSESRWYAKTAYALLMSGAASSAIDRISNGVVTNLFALDLPNAHWFAFNFADCWIALGCLLMFIAAVRRMHPSDLLGMF